MFLFVCCLARWDDELLVTRAPGRLDVMGGIADYSGSLVLQMPIAEACHVALQRHPLDKQQVWKHIKVRIFAHTACSALQLLFSAAVHVVNEVQIGAAGDSYVN
jgi:galactokinase